MHDRLTKAYDGNETALPRDEIAWNHGDLSPFNLKLLDDGRVAFIDLAMAFWGPPDWDLFALFICSYDRGFVEPLERAFHEKGLRLREDRKEMYLRFMIWHAQKGNAVARCLPPPFSSFRWV
jgi:aminoglycoside phosphotransferase (APT) family kinase protein